MSYLFPFIYLFLNSMTRIVVEGREILIQVSDEQSWKVSTPIYGGEGEFPQELSDCLNLIQRLKWERAGVLEVDTVLGTIHWVRQIHPVSFGREFPQFLKDAQEWAEILEQKLLLTH